jgi:Cache 3/Cache 2 fusion domain
LTQDGQSAAGTKLDRNSAAYKALSQKQSYTGSATLFGHDYDASYAPMLGAERQIDRCFVRGCAAIVGDPNLSSAAPALFSSPCAGVSFVSRQVNVA